MGRESASDSPARPGLPGPEALEAERTGEGLRRSLELRQVGDREADGHRTGNGSPSANVLVTRDHRKPAPCA